MLRINQIKTKSELLNWAKEKRERIIKDFTINFEKSHNDLKEIEDTFLKKFKELKI